MWCQYLRCCWHDCALEWPDKENTLLNTHKFKKKKKSYLTNTDWTEWDLSQARQLWLPESHSPRGREGRIGWAWWCNEDEWGSRKLALKRKTNRDLSSLVTTDHEGQFEKSFYYRLRVALPVCFGKGLLRLGPRAVSVVMTEPLHSEHQSLSLLATFCQSAKATSKTQRRIVMNLES